MLKIVAGRELDEDTIAAWREEFPDVTFISANMSGAQAAIQDADAYLGRIPRELFLQAGPQLRWVHSMGAGIESLTSIPELVESEVIVTNTRGAHAPCIGDHTFALLLALSRRIVDIAEDQRRSTWKHPGLTASLRELSGATMVIVGMGSVGREIAKRASAFDMRVLGVDLAPGAITDGVEAVWGLDRLDEALSQANVLVLAVPSTPSTHGLIDQRRLGLMPQDAYVLAVSRGGIIDETALVSALETGRIGGAGLDVLAVEPPPPDSPVWTAPNLILSPHCSGVSRQTRERVRSITRENVRRFVNGEPLANVCDKRAGF